MLGTVAIMALVVHAWVGGQAGVHLGSAVHVLLLHDGPLHDHWIHVLWWNTYMPHGLWHLPDCCLL